MITVAILSTPALASSTRFEKTPAAFFGVFAFLPRLFFLVHDKARLIVQERCLEAMQWAVERISDDEVRIFAWLHRGSRVST